MSFKSINEIKLDDIIAYCQKEGEIKWLKEVALAEDKVNKKGEPRKVSFIELRNEFCRKFYPELAPKKMTPKQSMYDLIRAL
jgi:hypothetical protein